MLNDDALLYGVPAYDLRQNVHDHDRNVYVRHQSADAHDQNAYAHCQSVDVHQ